MASKLYGQFLSQALNKEIDWDTDTIKVALLTNAYTPDQDSHNYFDDVSTYEVSGATGYTSAGITLANKTNTYSAGTNTIVLDADDVTWSSSTITARYAVVYDASPATNATRPLIGYVDFGSDQSSSNGNFTITWDATGIVRVTVA
jgi:hypothetical protein